MSATNAGKAPRIVVGVDGSPSSRVALHWAAQQARLTGATVDAVIAWQIPAAATGFGMAPIAPDECAYVEKNAKQVLDEVITDVVGPDDGVRVRNLVVQGFPAQVLLDAAAGANLLVVGSRGHGGFTSALLGSVSLHCVHHATCPVVVIRGDAADREAA